MALKMGMDYLNDNYLLYIYKLLLVVTVHNVHNIVTVMRKLKCD